jgi:hypothetical protein
MSGVTKILAVLSLALLVGSGEAPLSGQGRPQLPFPGQSTIPVPPPPAPTVIPITGLDPAIDRLAELGIRADSRSESSLGPAGTYVRADSFRLDTETGAVEAAGNVVILTVQPDATPVVAIRSERMTFGQAFEPRVR